MEAKIKRRNVIAAMYTGLLASLPGVRFQEVHLGDVNTYKDYSIHITPELFGVTRDALAKGLLAENIETKKYFYPPLHEQDLYRRFHDPARGGLAQTEFITRGILSLPIYESLPDETSERSQKPLSDWRMLRCSGSGLRAEPRGTKAVLQRYRNFKPFQALPRMFADVVSVHLCMTVALAFSVVYHKISGQGVRSTFSVGEAAGYYRSECLLLSLLFPVVFLLNGFYTRSRGYIGRYKNLVVLRGVGLSILLFIAANFLPFLRESAPRSAVVLFCLLAMPSLVLNRMAKAAFLDRFEITRKKLGGPAASRGSVLVLGGAGFIGSCLVRKLLAAGRKVRVMDNLVYGDDAIRDVLGHPNFQLQVGDCRNIQDLVASVQGVESIIDLAAIVGDPACEVDRQNSLEVNYAATRMLIEVAKGNGTCRLIFASSCSVYGATDLLMDEYSNVQPLSLYGQTKWIPRRLS